MPFGYWIISVAVEDAERLASFFRMLTPVFRSSQAVILDYQDSQDEAEDGTALLVRIVQFPSLESANNCKATTAYAATQALRSDFSAFDLVVIEQAEF